jgi:TPR repeat protein
MVKNNCHVNKLLLVAGLVICSFADAAGFDDAMAAYQAKDYSKAIAEARQSSAAGDPRSSFLLGLMYQSGIGVVVSQSEAVALYEKAAQGGVRGSFAKLAQMYAVGGNGVPKNTDKALLYARQSTQLGDPEGMYFLYILLTSNSLSYIDSNGKVDRSKYQKLSTRPLSDRSLDIEAKDALYRSADMGYTLAIFQLALELGGVVGENNRARMLELTRKLPQHANKGLQSYEKIAHQINSLGESLASPQLFADAQASQYFSALMKTCGLSGDKEAIRSANAELVSVVIAKPLSNPTYLPSKVPGYERTNLVAGEWEEDWTYKGCNRTEVVRVKFVADGFGGARFYSIVDGKNIPKSLEQ